MVAVAVRVARPHLNVPVPVTELPDLLFNVQAEVSVTSSSKGVHFVCSAENDGTSLGGIDFTVKDNTISDFLMDGALCRMGNNSSDELVIVIGNQVYINEDAYSAFLSELS